MSARLLCWHVARLRHCASPRRRASLGVRNLHWENGEPEKEEEMEGVTSLPQNSGDLGDHALQYNPSAYHRSWVGRAALLGSAEPEEEPSPPALTPAFRQQSNPYSVASSRRLSSSNHTQLDLAFSRGRASKAGAAVSSPAKDELPDVRADPRAFQQCRLEYRSFSHDLSRRPPAIWTEETSLLLHKVTVLKGSMEPSDISHFLGELSRLPREQTALVTGDTRFHMLLRYSVESLQRFSPAQLLAALQAFVRLSLSPSHSVLGLYEAEFARRAAELELELHPLLLAADLWRCLGRPVPQYLGRVYDCVGPRLGRVDPAELVQLLYVIGEGRRCPGALLHPLELALLRHLDELKPEEVGAVCLGLFKSQSSLSDAAVRRLVDRAHKLVGEMSDFAVVNVLKLLRFSHLDHLGWLEAMGREVPRRAPQMGVQGLMHVALACSALHYRDDRILLAVAERLPELAARCRSKDAAKLLWAFSTLGLRPGQCPGLYPCLTAVLRQREAEFQRFPEHLLTALLGLAFAGQFPRDLLSRALSAEFVGRAAGSQQLELKKDLFTLDGTVALELPGWAGPRLSPAVREEVTRLLWDFAQADVCQKPEVLEAESVLQELLGGEGFVRKHMILPHLRSVDLEVHLDADGQPLPVVSELCSHARPPEPTSPWPRGWDGGHAGVTLTDDLLAQLANTRRTPAQAPAAPQQPPPLRRVESESERESVFSVGVDLTEGLLGALTKPGNGSPSRASPEAAVVRLAVQVSNRNHYCYRTRQLLGLHALKRRQLALAGYRVVELPHWEWLPLLRRSRTEKLAYLHCKIFSSHDSENIVRHAADT